ncbi:transcription elongation factor GreA [Candidatus Kuenenbacteria bacterium CG_4_9_14_3_um_filter_39_14]|uniref:Transcription elongation factor GreA n=6 Tax=Candidatus Kueneniibacteriota TaxID=1752740 RepID=A0A2M7MGM1_9BACT|nr:MAG: transcription elongation factor GreA [Candidatus Kuenenbacteria bacterium CG23_combo_of_CG06-09_8_20_14_all_39_39]PIP75365.1 MAG: transcription elongation factor GreA [Candidatus Kuenenbacteria bacterium CG22_combo_CG10-13_8_21_14_all_39_9]PIR81007.1 MAG: transcription elongation factor GreA [Candidatus Kuenenbacteria bacterium CG10_big_fil_rev_8_21_14_0_10_39_14]PIX92230.1 MAG: transcription elongation factor GreA [Candidatus Kuenenbacteria bacterium CG_4_10_14_3_um_filter_39_14]PJA922
MPDNNKIYITLDGLQKLKDQLKYLINIERKNIAEHIQEAKELGDLSENAEYSAAKDEQAFLEMKIAELDSAIKNAVVIEENGNSGNGIVGVGSTVKFKDEADNKKECTIVGCHESDPLNNKISNESPIGRAFLGHKKGDTVEFQAPKGLVRYKILDIK